MISRLNAAAEGRHADHAEKVPFHHLVPVRTVRRGREVGKQPGEPYRSSNVCRATAILEVTAMGRHRTDALISLGQEEDHALGVRPSIDEDDGVDDREHYLA